MPSFRVQFPSSYDFGVVSNGKVVRVNPITSVGEIQPDIARFQVEVLNAVDIISVLVTSSNVEIGIDISGAFGVFDSTRTGVAITQDILSKPLGNLLSLFTVKGVVEGVPYNQYVFVYASDSMNIPIVRQIIEAK